MVQVAVGSDPIAGHVIDLQHRVCPFVGWIELTRAVDEAVRVLSVPSLPTPSETDMLSTENPPPTSRPGYLLDPAWHAERDRLNSLSQLYDPATVRLSTALGLRPGWRCLDVGAGTGSVAELFAAKVGPTGSVLAVDTDTRFLEPIATEILQVRRLDVTSERLPAQQFDLVHARLLLEHLPERDEVLGALVDAVAPGGWLLVEDFDWATATVVDPPASVHRLIADACMAVFAGHNYDPHFGRRLPRAFMRHGLVDVATHAESKQVRADAQGGVPQWELLVDQLSPALLACGLVTSEDLDAFHALWHDGDSICFAPLMVSTWGRRDDVRTAPATGRRYP